jgi:hypothetical protein
MAMRAEEAIRLVGMLAATGHGWTDLHVEVYASELGDMEDAAAAERAIRSLVRTWDKPVRIPIGNIWNAYRVEVERKPKLPPIPSTRERILSPAEGIEVAWRAYQREASLAGKEPNRSLFDRMLRNISR